MPNFNHCPIVWMFTTKKSYGRIENTKKKHALRFVLNDYQSIYLDLLNNSASTGSKVTTLRLFAIEIYNCVNNLKPE